jgi:CRP-like cAMP-binding protein
MINDDETNSQDTGIHLSDESKMALFYCFKKFEFPKGHILVKPNDICKHLYFIEKGSARIFYYKEGKDITDGFRGDETLLATMVSFIKKKPDKRGIELLEDSSLWAISNTDLEVLCDKHHDIERLYRIVMSSAVIMGQQRIDRMLFQSAQERYDDFIKTQKRASDLLTLGMIASFLGITQETLSRIRAKQ